MEKEFDFIIKSSGVPTPVYLEYKKLLTKITFIVSRVEAYINELEEGKKIDDLWSGEDKEELYGLTTLLEVFYKAYGRENLHKAEETYNVMNPRSQLNYSPMRLEAIIKKALGIKKIGE